MNEKAGIPELESEAVVDQTVILKINNIFESLTTRMIKCDMEDFDLVKMLLGVILSMHVAIRYNVTSNHKKLIKNIKHETPSLKRQHNVAGRQSLTSVSTVLILIKKGALP